VISGSLMAKEEKALPKPDAPAAAVFSPADEAKRAEMKKLVEAKKTELNGTEWAVTLTPSGSKANPEEDVLTFQDGKVVSKNFESKGFTATNYTITAPEGADMAIWETMQTSSNSKEGVIFIRGEWNKDTMRGVVSQQMDGGKSTKDYTFATTAKKAVPPSKAKEGKKDEAINPTQEPSAGEGQGPALVSEEEAPKGLPRVKKR
jgi:hypothetical protein